MADHPEPSARDASPPASPSLGAHSVVYLVGTALQGLGVLLVLPFATRVLGAAEFGRVATGLVVVQLVGTLAAAGLPQVILREHHRGAEGPRVARALAGAMVLLALGLAVAGALLTLALAAGGHADPGQWLPLVIASAGLTTVVSGQTLLRARLQPWGFLALAVLATVGAQLAGVLAARVDPSAGTYLTAYAGVVLVAAALAVVLGRPLRPSAERERVRAGARLAAPLLPQAAAMLGLLSGDVLLTRWLLGAAAAGEYQVALQIGNIPFVLAVALFNAWGPLVLSRPLVDRWSWTARTGSALVVVVTVGAGLVTGAALVLAHLLAGPSFDVVAVATAVSFLALVAVAYMVYQGSSLAVLDAERTGALARNALLALAVLVGLAAALRGWGILGIAVAKLVAYGVLMATTVLEGRRDLRWPGQAWAALAGGLVVAVVTAVAGGAVTRLVVIAVMLAVGAVAAPRVLRALRR
ncbi:MAG: polysaccharide biosynthesis protein [Humibacillus sp.]|nr:polysaccharide biosynthesis protein [Humibacillus sp.]